MDGWVGGSQVEGGAAGSVLGGQCTRSVCVQRERWGSEERQSGEGEEVQVEERGRGDDKVAIGWRREGGRGRGGDGEWEEGLEEEGGRG